MDVTPNAQLRPMALRRAPAAELLTVALVRAGVNADLISLASTGFAALAAACLVCSHLAPAPLLFTATAAIALRLACNLLDGMVARASRAPSRFGEMLNEFPDRVSDTLILIGAGYGASGWPAELGWAAALFAGGTAYTRVLRQSLVGTADFQGPMAKPARMAVMAAACLYSAFEPSHLGAALALALWVVCAGSVLTIACRLTHLVSALTAEASRD